MGNSWPISQPAFIARRFPKLLCERTGCSEQVVFQPAIVSHSGRFRCFGRFLRRIWQQSLRACLPSSSPNLRLMAPGKPISISACKPSAFGSHTHPHLTKGLTPPAPCLPGRALASGASHQLRRSRSGSFCEWRRLRLPQGLWARGPLWRTMRPLASPPWFRCCVLCGELHAGHARGWGGKLKLTH